ncbi:hypothetical protein LOTGIDRAFT_206138 [Lottia gigantea]|uniref:long-chain-fatty-acid--CoA ligase n=1 Tax=Lottia gigantea TaxID=225164 RepID=V4ATA8_LOTGI|nr:hypothetical protein LOTGIDRAFT_206138 [Lottia gigantea]ESP00513.1 hypothetical protein LOTGIDRAFT_206138 [Lottia gigantea]
MSVSRSPEKTCLIYEDCLYSYRMVDEYANKVANLAKSLGLKFGDTVSLYCTNSPQFIWTFLGFLKLGITVAMINTSLHSKSLSHSVVSSESLAIIVGEGRMGLPSSQLPSDFISFDDLMLRALPVPVDRSVRRDIKPFDTCCFIYTSGTTGYPKPVHIQHFKVYAFCNVLYAFSITPEDILYNTLPLFHSAGMYNLCSGLNVGCTIVLKKKFSAHEFWEDVVRYNVTIFQYIGELCRYLLSQPPSPLDSKHKVRAIIGNGLRKDIWTKFQTRFKIPLILEFFAATEGNTLLFQLSNKPGSCGRLSPFIQKLEPFPRRLVKYDYDTAEPLRDKNGRCIPIKPGEVGILLSGVNPLTKDLPMYKASRAENDKKIVRNAFVDGDEYFNYGDLLYLDKDYFLYFNDRIGDTFRWKGENVSTTEVANILTDIDFIHDANVYGVTVPGQDGRAGMAAITLYNDSELTTKQLKVIYEHCEKELPHYAVPIFLRVLKEDILTVTYKQKKRDIVKEGFDPLSVSDALYFRDSKRATYIPLTTDLYPVILKSKL